MGRSQPRGDRACRRARGRQGRFAPLARWPADGPSLTAAARAGMSRAQVGTEGWRAGHAAPRRPLPLPPRCRESWKRKRAVGAMSRRRLWLCSRLIVARALSATGEAITLVGLAEAAGGGKGGEALVEGGGADAAARAQLGEWRRAVDVGECGSDALVDGTGSRRLRGSRFDDLERE